MKTGKLFHKFCALFVSVCMLASMLPTVALAAAPAGLNWVKLPKPDYLKVTSMDPLSGYHGFVIADAGSTAENNHFLYTDSSSGTAMLQSIASPNVPQLWFWDQGRLYCTINGVPPVSDNVLQCSGAANAQNGASYIAKYKKDGAVVERAIANIAELYTSSVTVHTSTFTLPTSGTFDARVDSNNFPYGYKGHFYGVDSATGALTKVFALAAQTMRGSQEFNVNVLADMTQFSKFVCQAVRYGNVLYQCNANVTY